MDTFELRQVTETFRQLATRAAHDEAMARQLRDALAESGLLGVFGEGPAIDVVDLLDAGGEDALRARLKALPIADLRALIAAYKYDPQKETARWRSVARLTDFIVTHAQQALERMDQAQQQVVAAPSWML